MNFIEDIKERALTGLQPFLDKYKTTLTAYSAYISQSDKDTITLCSMVENQQNEIIRLNCIISDSGWIKCSERMPKSGTHVLLCCETKLLKIKYVCGGYYAKRNTIEGGCSDDCETEYSEEDDKYYLVEGFYEVIKNWGDYDSITIEDNVTQWMALPEPPKEADA